MKKLLYILCCIYFITVSNIANAQSTYNIDNFSDKYRAELVIDAGYDNAVFKKGVITIFSLATNQPLISIQSDEFTHYLDNDGTVRTNVSEIFYGEQSIIISQDFNFDGIPDLAIMDGQFSCYHGPSYQIYIDTKHGLKHSPSFTRLAQEYCGMFQVDHDLQRLYTLTKNGCCWHEFSIFKIEHDTPTTIHVVEQSLNNNGILVDISETKYEDDRMITDSFLMLNKNADINLVYQFTSSEEKIISIYRAFAYEDFLFFIMEDVENKIALYFDGTFIYNSHHNTLTFSDKGTTYIISEKNMQIIQHESQYQLDAFFITENTELKSLQTLNLKNLQLVNN